MRTQLTFLTAFILILARCDGPSAQENDKFETYRQKFGIRLTAIQAPEIVRIRPTATVGLFTLQSEEIPREKDEQKFRLFLQQGKGREIPISRLNNFPISEYGPGQLTLPIRLEGKASAPGSYQLCAQNISGKSKTVCSNNFKLLLAVGETCKKAFDTYREKNPALGCKCLEGKIKGKGREPDGSLAAFVATAGGNKLGPFDKLEPKIAGTSPGPTATIFSTYKFEPHFTIQFVEPPAEDAFPDCKPEEVRELLFGMCPEGQEVNAGFFDLEGAAPAYVADSSKPVLKSDKDIPYDPAAGATRIPDGDGVYSSPREATVPELEKSPTGGLALKAYDAPNKIHWLDAPGYAMGGALANGFKFLQKPGARISILKYELRIGFHSFVHGSDKASKDDDCDCFFNVQTARVTTDATKRGFPATIDPSLLNFQSSDSNKCAFDGDP